MYLEEESQNWNCFRVNLIHLEQARQISVPVIVSIMCVDDTIVWIFSNTYNLVGIPTLIFPQFLCFMSSWWPTSIWKVASCCLMVSLSTSGWLSATHLLLWWTYLLWSNQLGNSLLLCHWVNAIHGVPRLCMVRCTNLGLHAGIFWDILSSLWLPCQYVPCWALVPL